MARPQTVTTVAPKLTMILSSYCNQHHTDRISLESKPNVPGPVIKRYRTHRCDIGTSLLANPFELAIKDFSKQDKTISTHLLCEAAKPMFPSRRAENRATPASLFMPFNSQSSLHHS